MIERTETYTIFSNGPWKFGENIVNAPEETEGQIKVDDDYKE